MFTLDDMRRLLTTTPFVPFRLHLSDGNFVDVRHRELATAGRRYALIGVPDPADPDAAFDYHVTVYYMHVTRTETLVPGPPPDGPPASPDSPVPSPTPV